MADIDFGDIEPEDSWDATDTIVEQLNNLRRRVIAVLLLLAVLANDPHGPVAARVKQRLEMLRDDLDFVRHRFVRED